MSCKYSNYKSSVHTEGLNGIMGGRVIDGPSLLSDSEKDKITTRTLKARMD